MIGTLSLHGEHEQLEVRELDGSCNQVQVVAYLETLAEACDPEHLTVVVLDNAPFHQGEQIKEHRAAWEARGLFLRYLPAYCPQLNLIEETVKMCWGRVGDASLPALLKHQNSQGWTRPSQKLALPLLSLRA